MEQDKPHRSTSTPTKTTELFICFSHSSSKSIHCPGKKSKDGGSGFDNPEPSSPKVTCIGQVRVKTKEQGRKMKMRGGLAPLRNQGWVHLPGSICQAIRGFGNDFTCLVPCKSSSCFSGNCSNEGADNEAEIVVGCGDDMIRMVKYSRRRSILDDMEFEDEMFEVKKNGGEVSICVPPKNALLLMRCRSDPVRLSALSQNICVAPADDFDFEDECEDDNNKVENGVIRGENEVDLVKETKDKEEGKGKENIDVSNSNKLCSFGADSWCGKEIEGINHQEEMVKSNAGGDDDVEQGQSQRDMGEVEELKKPDCLVLMMCEPKLSSEVCKETWVCTTDFGSSGVRSDEPRCGVESPVRAGRCSISFPSGGGPVVSMIEHKLVESGGGGLEGFVLGRCKSAPVGSAGKNGMPEVACGLWRRGSSRKVEPHRPSFGMTGVGF